MSDAVQGVAEVAPGAAADPAASDAAALGKAFQAALTNAAMFLLGTAMPDSSEDSIVNPDAPF